jgi:sulfur carrier protein
MRITVNGEECALEGSPTLEQLIESRGLQDAACATEVNQRLVPKRDRSLVALEDGDRIEIVTLVGGG